MTSYNWTKIEYLLPKPKLSHDNMLLTFKLATWQHGFNQELINLYFKN